MSRHWVIVYQLSGYTVSGTWRTFGILDTDVRRRENVSFDNKNCFVVHWSRWIGHLSDVFARC